MKPLAMPPPGAEVAPLDALAIHLPTGMVGSLSWFGEWGTWRKSMTYFIKFPDGTEIPAADHQIFPIETSWSLT